MSIKDQEKHSTFKTKKTKNMFFLVRQDRFSKSSAALVPTEFGVVPSA